MVSDAGMMPARHDKFIYFRNMVGMVYMVFRSFQEENTIFSSQLKHHANHANHQCPLSR